MATLESLNERADQDLGTVVAVLEAAGDFWFADVLERAELRYEGDLPDESGLSISGYLVTWANVMLNPAELTALASAATPLGDLADCVEGVLRMIHPFDAGELRMRFSPKVEDPDWRRRRAAARKRQDPGADE